MNGQQQAILDRETGRLTKLKAQKERHEAEIKRLQGEVPKLAEQIKGQEAVVQGLEKGFGGKATPPENSSPLAPPTPPSSPPSSDTRG